MRWGSRGIDQCPYKEDRPKEILQHDCVCYDCVEYEPGCSIRPTIVPTHHGIPVRDILAARAERPVPVRKVGIEQMFIEDPPEWKPSWAQRFYDGWAILNGDC
jgi:hypothetical protein